MSNFVGRVFYHPDDFAKYVDGVKAPSWCKFIVQHNTSTPDLSVYNGWQTRAHPVTDEQWVINLWNYWTKEKGWSGGPHIITTPRSWIVANDLAHPGVHSPSWNRISWGVETVGEFDKDPFDGAIKQNTIIAQAILHHKLGKPPFPYERGVKGLHFHREDPRTTHKNCPGVHVSKSGLVSAVVDEIARRWPPAIPFDAKKTEGTP